MTHNMTPPCRQFAALSDPNRLAIFERLIRRPLSVGALAEHLPISRPAVSQHLAVLQEAGLVDHEKRGTQNIYRADPAGLAALRDYLDVLWAHVLGDFKLAAEAAWQQSKRSKR